MSATPLPLPFSTFNTRSQAGAFAGFDDIVKLSLADWDGHAGVTIGVLGFADLRRDVFFPGGGLRLVSSEPIEHYRGKEAEDSVRLCDVRCLD